MIRLLAKKILLKVPAIRQVVEQRNAALAELAVNRAKSHDIGELLREKASLEAETYLLKSDLNRAISAADEERRKRVAAERSLGRQVRGTHE